MPSLHARPGPGGRPLTSTRARVAAEDHANGATPTLVALTGWGQPADRRRSLDAGFDDHLVKPVDVDALESLLSS